MHTGSIISKLDEIAREVWQLANVFSVLEDELKGTSIEDYKAKDKLYYLPVGFKGKDKLQRMRKLPLDISKSSILSEIVDDIDDDAKKIISEQDFQIKIRDAFLSRGKSHFVIYLHSDKLVDPLFRAISLEFNDMDFTSFREPSEKFLQSFNLQPAQLPVIAALEKPNDLEKGQYKMSLLPLLERREYTTLIKDFSKLKETEETDVQNSVDQKESEELTNQNIDKCSNFKGLCVIAILKGDSNIKNQIAIADSILTIKKPISLRVFWVNGSCHYLFGKSLNVDLTFLPTFVVLHGSKKTYSNMIGIFSQGSVANMIDGFLGRRVIPLKNLTMLASLDEDCTQGVETSSIDPIEEQILRDTIRENEEKAANNTKKKKKKNKKADKEDL